MTKGDRTTVHAVVQTVKPHLPWADLQGLTPEQSAFQRTHPTVRRQVLDWLSDMGHHDAFNSLVGIHRAQSHVDAIRAQQGRPSPYKHPSHQQPYLNPMDTTLRMRAISAKLGDCYRQAYRVLMDAPEDWTMIHGDMLSPLDRRPGGPYPNGHAVLIDSENNLHDPASGGATWPDGAWQYIYNFQPGYRTFTKDQARQEVADRDGIAGPWHETKTDYDRFGGRKMSAVVPGDPQYGLGTGHTAPGGDSPTFDNPEDYLPDVYEHPEYYASPFDRRDPAAHRSGMENHRALLAARGNPDALVKIYRAVPHGITDIEGHTNPAGASWVSASPAYAKRHAESESCPGCGGNMQVISGVAKAGQLHNEGYLEEWGYTGDPLHDPSALTECPEGAYEARKAEEAEFMRRHGAGGPDRVWYHGTPDERTWQTGAAYGIHIGTEESAHQALNARIGRPLEGIWDGTREYGKTLLSPYQRTGTERDLKNARYPSGQAVYSNGVQVPMDARPSVFPVRITGPMTNSEHNPHHDDYANSRMHGQITRGQARRGYYYTNASEDEGSVSAVVPSATHLERLGRQRHEAAAIPDESGLKAAGIAVIAMDTGRILMQQRALNPIMCPCGQGVTWDEMNGYQHDDGSVSHDDSDMSVSEMLDQGHPEPFLCPCCLGRGDDEQGVECTSCDGSGVDAEQSECTPPCREIDQFKTNERIASADGWGFDKAGLDKTAALEFDPNEGTWEFPGGKLDPGESPRAAAIREFREEVGQDLPPGVFVGAWVSPGGITVAAAAEEALSKIAVDESFYHGTVYPHVAGDEIDPQNSRNYSSDEFGETGPSQPVKRVFFTKDQSAAARYGEEPGGLFRVEPTGPYSEHPWERGTLVSAHPLRVVERVDPKLGRVAAKKTPVYKGFIYLIQSEKDIDLGNRVIANPDDPDGDMSEQSAWWEIEHAKKNPALRREVKKDTPWAELELWADKSVRTNKEIKEALAKLAMPRDDAFLSSLDFRFEPAGLENRVNYHKIIAAHPSDGEVGSITWWPAGYGTSSGKIMNVTVDKDRRRGLATELLRRAKEKAAEEGVQLRHSLTLRPDGEMMINGIGDYPGGPVLSREGNLKEPSTKCKYCKKPSTKDITHSEGMARIQVCDEHLGKGKTDAANCTPDGSHDPSNVDSVKTAAASPPSQAAWPLIRDVVTAGRPEFYFRSGREVPNGHHNMIANLDRPVYHQEASSDPTVPKIYALRNQPAKGYTFLAPVTHPDGRDGWLRGVTSRDPAQWQFYENDDLANAARGQLPRSQVSVKVRRRQQRSLEDKATERLRATVPDWPGDVPLDDEGHQIIEPWRDTWNELGKVRGFADDQIPWWAAS